METLTNHQVPLPGVELLAMSEAVPTIYAPPIRRVRLSLYGRALALALAAGCAIVIATAISLRPSPEGVGTHQGLGFLSLQHADDHGHSLSELRDDDQFRVVFKGTGVASWYVQPAGFVLALLTGVLLFCYAAYEVVTGRPIHRLWGSMSFTDGGWGCSLWGCLRSAGDGRSLFSYAAWTAGDL